MKTRRRLLTVTFFTAAMFGGMPAFAADSPAAAPTVAAKPAVGRTRLPEEMPYQKTLRAYLGSLTEKDFDHGIAVQSLKVTPVAEDDDAFRTWLLSLEVPRVGRKRSYPSVNLARAHRLARQLEIRRQPILQLPRSQAPCVCHRKRSHAHGRRCPTPSHGPAAHTHRLVRFALGRRCVHLSGRERCDPC